MTTSNIEVFSKIEFAEDDTRQGAGRVKGSLIRWGEVASDRPIMFTNGLTWDADGLVLNIQHDRGRHLARFSPTPTADGLALDVILPDTAASRDAVTLIKAKVLRGISAEIIPESEDMLNGIRRVTKGKIVGAALVDGPSFRSSTVSVHARQDKRRRIWQ